MQFNPITTPKSIDLEEVPQYCILDRGGWKHFIFKKSAAKGKLTTMLKWAGWHWYRDTENDKTDKYDLGQMAVYKLDQSVGKYLVIFEAKSDLGQAFENRVITKDEMYNQINW